LTLDSPIGPLSVRACDHQLQLPVFFGVTRKSPQYDFLVAGDVVSVPAKDFMPTCEEIRKARSK
jgi:branched-chain amino acid transport system substrate-binding protein